MASRQPLLHDLLATVQAPTQVWSGRDGQIRAVGAQGIYHGDVRVVAEAVIRVGGAEPEVGERRIGRSRSDACGCARARGRRAGRRSDGAARSAPTRQRRLGRRGADDLLLHGRPRARDRRDPPADRRDSDGAGQGGAPVIGRRDRAPARCGGAAGDDLGVAVDAHGARTTVDRTAGTAVLAWDVEAATGRPATVSWAIAVTDQGGAVGAPAQAEPEWARPEVVADDRRLAILLEPRVRRPVQPADVRLVQPGRRIRRRRRTVVPDPVRA